MKLKRIILQSIESFMDLFIPLFCAVGSVLCACLVVWAVWMAVGEGWFTLDNHRVYLSCGK